MTDKQNSFELKIGFCKFSQSVTEEIGMDKIISFLSPDGDAPRRHGYGSYIDNSTSSTACRAKDIPNGTIFKVNRTNIGVEEYLRCVLRKRDHGEPNPNFQSSRLDITTFHFKS